MCKQMSQFKVGSDLLRLPRDCPALQVRSPVASEDSELM